MKSRYLTFLAGVATGAVLLAALGGLRAPGTSKATARNVASKVRDSHRVRINDALAVRAKIATRKLEPQTLSPQLHLVGSVVFDANQVAEVGARIEGRITRMLVTPGDVVHAEQPLAEIESDRLGEVVSELLSTRANLIAAQHNELREVALNAKQLSRASLLERARAEVKALEAQTHGAEQRLLAMGLSKRELKQLENGMGPRRITLRTPLDGQVVERLAVLGQVVGPTEPVFKVANLDELWVELDLFEHDLSRVTAGSEAEIESETYPGKTFRGRVAYVDASVDMATRTASVRIEVDNRDRLLRPGQFVRARLATNGAQQAALRVPRKAVLQVEGEPTVFVVQSPREFLACAVELGAQAGDYVEVTRGLKAGDEIVTAGAFALKSELLR